MELKEKKKKNVPQFKSGKKQSHDQAFSEQQVFRFEIHQYFCRVNQHKRKYF